MAKHLTILGCVVAAIGAAAFIYAVSFNSPYPGYSGGGMAGLEGAVTIMLAIAMMVVGAAVAVHRLRRRVTARGQKRRQPKLDALHRRAGLLSPVPAADRSGTSAARVDEPDPRPRSLPKSPRRASAN